MMNQPSPAVQISAAALFLLVAWAGGVGCSSPAPSPWESWDTLRLDARAGPLFSGNVVMRLQVQNGKKLFETESTARLLGARIAESRTLTVMNESSGRTERYDDISRDRVRRYVFGETGYTVERLSPASGADRPIDEWEVTAHQEFDYPTDAGGGTADVYDYFGMILHLRNLDLRNDGDEAVVHVATPDGPTAFRVVVGETRDAERTVVDSYDSSIHRIFSVREQRLRIIPVDLDKAPAGFLKIEGEVELWVEARSKTLVQISGSVPNVPAKVQIELAQMGRAAQPLDP